MPLRSCPSRLILLAILGACGASTAAGTSLVAAEAPPVSAFPKGRIYLTHEQSVLVVGRNFFLIGRPFGSTRRVFCLRRSDRAETRRRLNAVIRRGDWRVEGRAYLTRSPQELTVFWRGRRLDAFTGPRVARRTLPRAVRRLVRHVLRLRSGGSADAEPITERASSNADRLVRRCAR